MRAYGAERYPYLESGAGVHTLLALARTSKRHLIPRIRGLRKAPTVPGPLALSPGVVRWGRDLGKIRFGWRLALGREGRVELSKPLQKAATYLVFVAETDTIHAIGEVVHNVTSSLIGRDLALSPEEPGSEMPGECGQVFDLLSVLLSKRIVVLEEETATQVGRT
jgi:hypothetical protein